MKFVSRLNSALLVGSLVFSLLGNAENRRVVSTLPHLVPSKGLVLKAEQSLSLRLRLGPGWEVSRKAPSWLAVFEEARSDKFSLVKEYKRSELVPLSITLPALKNGVRYRLQATFYSCKEGVGSLCRLESRDLRIQADRGLEAQKELEIDLRDPK